MKGHESVHWLLLCSHYYLCAWQMMTSFLKIGFTVETAIATTNIYKTSVIPHRFKTGSYMVDNIYSDDYICK